MVPRLIADRYELADRLGSGGGGTVWRARDTSLGRTVAVKEIVLAHDLPPADRDLRRTRALREARAAAQIQHRNVVSVYDVQSTDDAIFIVMEYVDAPSLKQVVATDGPLTPEAAAQVGLDVLAALQAAHAAGVVHRDIKPGNVLVGGPNGAQVTDFGIAAVTDDATLTLSGQALGTPDYISPEQVTDAPVGPATDVWSLGATLYHAVEGEPPFRRERSMSTVHAVVHDSPRPMVRAGGLAGVLTAMLAKDPTDRPTVPQARAHLAAVVEGRAAHDATTAMAPVADRTVRLPPPPVAAPPPDSASPPPPERARPARGGAAARPRTGRWAAVILGLLLLVVATALLLSRLTGPGTEPADTTVEPTDTATTDPAPPPATSSPSPQDTTPTETEAPATPDPTPTTDAPETPSPEPTTDPSPEPTATPTAPPPTTEPAPTTDPTTG